MSILDVIIIACMVFLMVRGLFRGFIREVGSLAGVILGIWLGSLLQPSLTDLLDAYLPWGKFLPLISFALIFALVLVLCNVAGWFLNKVIKKIFLGWADRALGAGLAVLKGIIITYFAIVLLTFFVPSKSRIIADSKLAPFIINSYQSMVGLLSTDTYQELKEKFVIQKKRVEKAISERIE
ncbi:MAG TPA: CvpA family protein [Deltaproteobacteria bacterium]|nr:CvpA family protein [Deltaproteobacteria bacterium]HDZ89448.1 CvpA family protein [Deltaproteobacteria bacterium]